MSDERITSEMVEKARCGMDDEWLYPPERAMRAALEAVLPFLLAEKDAEMERERGQAKRHDLYHVERLLEAQAERDAALAEVERLHDICRAWKNEQGIIADQRDAAWTERDALRAKVAAVEAVHARYFDLDGTPGFDDTTPEPEDVWRYDRDFRGVLADAEPTP